MTLRPAGSAIGAAVHIAVVLVALSALVFGQVPAMAQEMQVASLQSSVFDAEPIAQQAPAGAQVLTPAVLAAYVARQQAKKSFDVFGSDAQPELTSAMVSAYATTHFENAALAAIDGAAVAVPLADTFSFEQPVSAAPSITEDALAQYIHHGYLPTAKRIVLADHERRCLSTAIYHEARGESVDGQWAVANVIINRAMSKRFPSTMCGVVYQNAGEGRYRCQFTFACDGHVQKIVERQAWSRAQRIASAAFSDFQRGRRPGVVPGSALYYHTRSVSPGWSNTYREVAEIGAHVFYSPL